MLQKSHVMVLVAGLTALVLIGVITITLLRDAPDRFGRQSNISLHPSIESTSLVDREQRPVLMDENLTTEKVASGFLLPTSMAFIGEQDIIVLEKNSGSVYLLSVNSLNDSTRKELLKLNIANGAEQGLLGVAVADMYSIGGLTSGKTFVFLYMTESTEDGRLLGNSVYRYEWDAENETLAKPSLVVRLPAAPGPINNGGKLVVSNEGHLYVVVGDLNRIGGPLQNQSNGNIDDSSVILRIDFDGDAIDDNPFVHYERAQLSRYYAYGIRNSFGMAIDPVTGTLWATENGQNEYDEINLVRPGFNSGWSKVMGPIERSEATEDDLFFLRGAKYYDPVFSWSQQIGPTDIEFLNSDALGEEYRNNIFVGDINGGALYYFKVNESRTGLDLSDHPELSDGVAETYQEGFLARIGSFPGGITHIETGPDGYLYVLTFDGNIYRIVPVG